MKKRMVLIAGVLTLTAHIAEAALRAPSVPLVTVDPYFSVWSPADKPTDCDTETWFPTKQPIYIWIELDGVKYRLLGGPTSVKAFDPQAADDVPALPCTACEIRPLTTLYRYSNGKASVELSFLTPQLTSDLDVFSRPVTYVTVKTTGGGKVRVSARISKELVTNDNAAKTVEKTLEIAGMEAVCIGREQQEPLSQVGDKDRCNWGYAYLIRPAVDGNDVHFMLAYDDVKTLMFLGDVVQAWWKRGGKSFETMIGEAERDYARVVELADRFDREFAADMERLGGVKYRELTSLAYRQSFGACKLVAGKDGRPLYFSKENSSNGCMGTTDVFYPQLPHLLLTSMTLTKASLEPILVYAASGKWKYPYAPHDVGRWPVGNGQFYNLGDKIGKGEPIPGDGMRMPVEECGNMLIGLGAVAVLEKKADFAARWWPTVTQWAAYLSEHGFDPVEQLCTDDYAGQLGHNVNLSVKSIVALACYARLCEMRGLTSEAGKYRSLAESWVTKWMEKAKGGAGGGYRLAFDQPGSWSLKYNLVWDRLLGLNLFPKSVRDAELAVYRANRMTYGIPLDNRKPYMKPDWIFWVAGLSESRTDLDLIVDGVWKFLNETPDRVPFSDWYYAHNARWAGFQARSPIGAVFMPAFYDKSLVSKWQAPESTPEGIRYQNPLWKNEVYDPSWMKTADGTYYLVSTEREVLKSRDFVHWELAAKDFFSQKTLEGIYARWRNIWAPKVMDFDGKGDYRIYVAHSSNELHSAVYVYQSDKPEGPYGNGRMITYGAETGIEDSIDPDVIRDPETGTWWLFFGSLGGNYILELSPDGLSAKPGAKPIHVAGLPKGETRRRYGIYEGTSIVRRGDWWYYLAGAGEWWRRNYRIVCGRSRKLTGPYVDREGYSMKEGYAETLMSSGRATDYFSPGHPSEMFTSPSGRTYVYHFCNSSLDWKKGRSPALFFRPLMLAEIKWTDDGWPYFEGDHIQRSGELR